MLLYEISEILRYGFLHGLIELRSVVERLSIAVLPLVRKMTVVVEVSVAISLSRLLVLESRRLVLIIVRPEVVLIMSFSPGVSIYWVA